MSAGVELTAVDGGNPFGFLAALGTLAAAERVLGAGVRLAWGAEVVCRPRIGGVAAVDDLVDAVLVDRDAWRSSPALDFAVGGAPAKDVKFLPDDVRAYLAAARDAGDGGRSAGLATSLLAEFAVDGNGRSKPSDLHFTAGQQQFLVMARELRDRLTADHVLEALSGPWAYGSKLPSFMWDVGDDRVYALTGFDPAGTKKLTVPGAEWLALLGLSLLPTVARGTRVTTTGCAGTWKRGTFSWPLWHAPGTAAAVRTLLSTPTLTSEVPDGRLAGLGVFRVLRSTIERSDQGGYGSFRPPVVVWEAAAG